MKIDEIPIEISYYAFSSYITEKQDILNVRSVSSYFKSAVTRAFDKLVMSTLERKFWVTPSLDSNIPIMQSYEVQSELMEFNDKKNCLDFDTNKGLFFSHHSTLNSEQLLNKITSLWDDFYITLSTLHQELREETTKERRDQIYLKLYSIHKINHNKVLKAKNVTPLLPKLNDLFRVKIGSTSFYLGNRHTKVLISASLNFEWLELDKITCKVITKKNARELATITFWKDISYDFSKIKYFERVAVNPFEDNLIFRTKSRLNRGHNPTKSDWETNKFSRLVCSFKTHIDEKYNKHFPLTRCITQLAMEVFSSEPVSQLDVFIESADTRMFVPIMGGMYPIMSFSDFPHGILNSSKRAARGTSPFIPLMKPKTPFGARLFIEKEEREEGVKSMGTKFYHNIFCEKGGPYAFLCSHNALEVSKREPAKVNWSKYQKPITWEEQIEQNRILNVDGPVFTYVF